MKTLDEVIRAVHHCGLLTGFDDYYEYDGGCPYADCSACEKKRMLGKDVIKYLNEYRKQMTDPDGDHQQLLKCQSLLQELYSNEPLTWSELKQMEGKPVWVEHLKDGVVYKAGWCLIVQVDDSLPDIPCVGLVDTDADYRNLEVEWMDMGQWQAYRKERE